MEERWGYMEEGRWRDGDNDGGEVEIMMARWRTGEKVLVVAMCICGGMWREWRGREWWGYNHELGYVAEY